MKTKILTHLLLILLASTLSYFPAFNGDFISDDRAGIQHNQKIEDLSSSIQSQGVIRGAELHLAYRLYGYEPIGFRIYNIVFHIASAFVLYGLLTTLYGGVVPIVASLLFAVHPLLSEAVIWISAYSYPQYTFFVLLSLWLYVIYRKDKRLRFFILSLTSYSFALLSSEKAVIFPLILLSYNYSSGLKKAWKSLLPYFVGPIILVANVWSHIGPRVSEFQIINHASTLPIQPVQRILFSVGMYLSLIALPIHLTFYPVPDVPISGGILMLFFVLICIYVHTVIVAYRKNKEIFFWLTFFILALLPTVLAFGIAVTAADRYAYLATVGLVVAAALYIERFKQKYRIVFLGIIVVVLVGRTMIRAADWQTEEQFWLSTVRVSSNNAAAHNNLGAVLLDGGDCERAISEFTAVIRLRPNTSEAYHNLGMCYETGKNYDQALYQYSLALKYNPNQWQSRLRRMQLLKNIGRDQEANEDEKILKGLRVPLPK